MKRSNPAGQPLFKKFQSNGRNLCSMTGSVKLLDDVHSSDQDVPVAMKSNGRVFSFNIQFEDDLFLNLAEEFRDGLKRGQSLSANLLYDEEMPAKVVLMNCELSYPL